MNLLTPPQGKSRIDTENASQQVRAAELDKLIAKKRKELNDLDNQLINSQSEIGIRGVSEEQFWKERIAELTTEVEALESRKKSASVPLAAREKEVEDKERVLVERTEHIALRETEAEAEKEALESRLDEVSEREQDASQYAILLNTREFALSIKENELNSRMEALTEILLESLEETKKAQLASAAYKAILKGRDVSISEREKYVETQLASFADRETSILDKYRTLHRTITEGNLKNERTGLPDSKRPE